MNSRPFNLLEIIHEHQLRDFLSNVTQDGALAISVFDSKGHSVSDRNSKDIPIQQVQEITSRSDFQDLLNRILSTRVLNRIERSPGLPIYGAPLSSHGIPLGALIAWFAKDQDPTNSHRDFRLIWFHLQDLLKDGYELHNLSSEIVRNYEELTLLYNLSTRLGGQSDLNRIYKIIIEQVRSILPNATAAFMLVDEEKREIVSRVVMDGKGHPLPPVRLELNTGITGQVISTCSPAIVCNVHDHPSFVEVGYPITSLLSVPITKGDKVFGAINVSDKEHGAEFTSIDLKLVSAIAAGAAVALENTHLLSEVKDLYLSAVKSLVMAIDAKDPYTHSHSLRVSHFSMVVAQILGLDNDQVEDIKLAALLHDVGKIGVPEHVLLKPNRLTHEEWEEMKQHPLHSSQILGHFRPFQHIAQWIRYEHEHYNGEGYPDRLKGEEIPLPSRIIAAADAFDAITSDRYYRKRRSEEAAMEILMAHAGTKFDPKVIEAFVTAFQEGKLKADLLQ